MTISAIGTITVMRVSNRPAEDALSPRYFMLAGVTRKSSASTGIRLMLCDPAATLTTTCWAIDSSIGTPVCLST